jgi:hypothetical protein
MQLYPHVISLIHVIDTPVSQQHEHIIGGMIASASHQMRYPRCGDPQSQTPAVA